MNKTVRTISIIAVVVAIFAVIIASSSTKQSASDQVWNMDATLGNADSNNYYVMYTDLMCPYCNFFSHAVMEDWDKFEEYVENNNILFEVRLTDYIYDTTGSQYSRDGAEATYCAMREHKFWDYYHAAVQSLWDDYLSKGIGDSHTSPRIQDMPADYWKEIGHEVGLGDGFDDCITNHDTLDEVITNTTKAMQVAQGMPYFKFNDFVTAGFDKSWGWDYVEMYLDAGLKKKS